MTSTFLQFRSDPTLSLMSSSSKLNHTYNTNQKMAIESKQSHPFVNTQTNNYNYDKNNNINNNNDNNNNNTSTQYTNNNISTPFQPHSTDKIHLKSTNRSSHHEVSADNWRIRYYMNLNLVKHPSLMQYRSSSLPSKTTTNNNNDNNNNKKQNNNNQQNNEQNIELKQNDYWKKKHKKNNNKNIHILRKRKNSQNNTPPYHSMLRKHHKNKKSRLSRMRSRSDGVLSFHTINDNDNDNDNNNNTNNNTNNNNKLDNDDSDDEYINNLNMINTKISLPKHHQSSRTPPGIQRNRYTSEPIQIQNITKRSKPLSINKNKIKPRFNVDFNLPQTSYQASSPNLFIHNLTNTDSLVDDEANFDME